MKKIARLFAGRYLRFALLLPLSCDFAEARPTDYTLPVPLIWALRSGRSLELAYEREKETRITCEGRLVYSIPYPNLISSAVVSENKTALLFKVSRCIAKGAYYYDHLLVIKETAPFDFSVQARLAAQTLRSDRRRWISQLGAVSDSGDVALVQMAEPDRPSAPYKTNVTWQTLDLESGRVLKTGPSVGD
jgi:hypothetical protein